MGLVPIVGRVHKKKSGVSDASAGSDATRGDREVAAHAQCVSLARIETTYPACAHLIGPEGLARRRTRMSADAITIHPLRPERLRTHGNQLLAVCTLMRARASRAARRSLRLALVTSTHSPDVAIAASPTVSSPPCPTGAATRVRRGKSLASELIAQDGFIGKSEPER